VDGDIFGLLAAAVAAAAPFSAVLATGGRSGPLAAVRLAAAAKRAAATSEALYGFAGPPPRLYAIDPRTLRAQRDRSAPIAGHAFG
jgi:hypothetical protein